MSAAEKKLLVIDVDVGVDDVVALMIALGAPNIDVLGITCYFGNTSVENVCKNVFRVLQKCNSLQIPVYQGASAPFFNNLKSDNCFGKDALGDIPDPDAPGLDKIQQEHAVPAMISQQSGQVIMSQNFMSNVLHKIVLKKARFLKEINAYNATCLKKQVQKSTTLLWTPGYLPSDCFAITAALDEALITEAIVCAVSVELAGFYTGKMMVLGIDDKLQKTVPIMMECNAENFKALLIDGLK